MLTKQFEAPVKMVRAFGCAASLDRAPAALDGRTSLLQNSAGVRRAKPADAAETLRRIASLAHDGGLAAISEGDVLAAIRRLTLAYWSSSGAEAQRASAVCAAKAGGS